LQRIALNRWYEVGQTGVQFPVGARPKALSFDGHTIWVANEVGKDLAQLGASDGRVIRRIPLGSGPVASTFDGEHIWIANSTENLV
jgi:hypothetical protein